MPKTYIVFAPEDELDKFKAHQGEALDETLMDAESRDQFRAKIIVSQSPQEGYDKLLIQVRGSYIPEEWYVKILERQEEDEEVTVFQSMKLGERRGYMLRSMMSEKKAEAKKETMTTELERRLKRKQEEVKRLLGKEKGKKK